MKILPALFILHGRIPVQVCPSILPNKRPSAAANSLLHVLKNTHTGQPSVLQITSCLGCEKTNRHMKMDGNVGHG